MSDIRELKRVYLEKKTRISAVGQKIPPFIFLFFWIILFGLMAYLCITSFFGVFLVMALFFALFAYLSVRSIKMIRTVYADENFMYVRNGSIEEQVPFEHIYAGSKPFMRLASSLEAVKIYYKSEKGEKRKVKFVPALINQTYNQFIDAIAAKNISVKIKRSFL